MGYMIQETYSRQVYYIKEMCPDFQDTWWDFVAVIMSLVPFYVYYSTGVLFIRSPTLWWLVFGVSLSFNAIIIKCAGLLLPIMNNGSTQCGAIHHDRPCEEVAVMFFTLFFWANTALREYERDVCTHAGNDVQLLSVPKDRGVPMSETLTFKLATYIQHTIVLATAAGLTAYAMVSLHIFTPTNVALGAALGACTGLLMCVVYYSILEPNSSHYLLRITASLCCVRDRVFYRSKTNNHS